jgi:sortase A
VKVRMARRRWIAVLMVVGVVVAAGVTTAAVSGRGTSRAAQEDLPIVSTTPATGPATPTTHRKKKKKAKLRTLPQPERAPEDPYAPTPLVEVGVIEIPKIGLAHKVYEGITLTVIDHGPGHWPGSALPCQIGNTVFPGHRVTHSHPFLNIDLLSPGDQIVFHMPARDCVYAVTGSQIVSPEDVWVTDPTPKPTATIIACHPKHSAAQRIVVKSELIAKIPRAKTKESA